MGTVDVRRGGRAGVMWGGPTGRASSGTALRDDPATAGASHHSCVQIHGVHTTRSEPRWQLWASGDGVLVRLKNCNKCTSVLPDAESGGIGVDRGVFVGIRGVGEPLVLHTRFYREPKTVLKIKVY